MARTGQGSNGIWNFRERSLYHDWDSQVAELAKASFFFRSQRKFCGYR